MKPVQFRSHFHLESHVPFFDPKPSLAESPQLFFVCVFSNMISTFLEAIPSNVKRSLIYVGCGCLGKLPMNTSLYLSVSLNIFCISWNLSASNTSWVRVNR